MTVRRGFTLDFRSPDSGDASRRAGTDSAPGASGAFDPSGTGAGRKRSEEKPLSVGQLTRRIKSLLEGQFPAVTVEGEIGTLSRPPSGHLYLTLKDNDAALDAVVWRSAVGRLGFTPREGDKVVARGELTVYEPRGRYQMTIQSLRPAGEGDQLAALRELVARLRAEGLFEAARKRELPAMPGRIALVTSPGGAAVRDIIKVAHKRWPGVELIVCPCLVQGRDAPASIVRALAAAQATESSLVILGRGGGSAEDLAAFNDEAVARAVASCVLPVISAVGHEVDVSICDLVADARAATPSEAAEMAVPDVETLRARVRRLQGQMARALSGPLRQARLRLASVARSPALRRPLDLIRTRRQSLDELAGSLTAAGERLLERKKRALELVAAKLHSRSPLGVLGRGYSVTRTLATPAPDSVARAEDGAAVVANDAAHFAYCANAQESDVSCRDTRSDSSQDCPGGLVRDARSLRAGDLLRTDLQVGYVIARVERTGER